MSGDILDTLDELDDESFGAGEVLEGELLEEDFSLELDLDSYEMNERQAKEITEAIRSTTTALFVLLAQAHEHKAHKALGYDTWAEYVREEFEMSAQRSYQLLDLSKAVKMLEEATPEGTQIKLTEAQARDIKRELPRITEQIQEETAGLTPEEAAARAEELIEEQRNEIKEQKKADDKVTQEKSSKSEEEELEAHQAALEAQADALLEADRPDGLTDAADDGIIELDVAGDGAMSAEDSMHIFNFFNSISSVQGLPDADTLLDLIPEARYAELEEQITEVAAYFNLLASLLEERTQG